jgi:hypothetical protein
MEEDGSCKKVRHPPIRTFANYAHDDHSMQAKIGAKVGRPSNVTEEDREFMVQLLVRADRANEGLTCKYASDTLVTLTERTDKPLNEMLGCKLRRNYDRSSSQN